MKKVKIYELIEKPLSGVWGDEVKEGNGVPVLRTTNFTNDGVLSYSDVVTRKIVSNNLEDKYLRVGDILIEKSGGSDKQPVGRVVYFEAEENKFLFNNFTSILRIKNFEICCPKFLFYALFFNYQQGGTRPYENKTTGLHNLKLEQYIGSIEIPLLSLEKQKTIVEILNKVSNLISLRKQQISKLEALVKSRFMEQFGDPVKSPKYPLVAIGQIGNVMTGTTPAMKKNEYYASNDIMFIKPGDIAEGYITAITSSETYISENARSVGRLFPEKSVLVTCIGTIGKVGISTKESSCNQQINVIVPSKQINYLYLAHALLYMKHYLKASANAPVVPILNKSDFSKITLLNPPLEDQEKFAAFVEQTDKTKLKIKQSLEKLETLKKSLMQKYFG